MNRHKDVLHHSVDEILGTSWDRKIAKDLADEIGIGTGDQIGTVREMRRFLALKGYRELLQLLREACAGKDGEEALAAIAYAMRRYGLDRPALSAAAFRTAAADCPEWREAHEKLHTFMTEILVGCGLADEAAEHALHMLRSLVRGYVLHEVMHTFIGVESYEASFDSAVRVFVAGLPALAGACRRSSDPCKGD
ncbi:TetR-like C-terminal domain-containing protein [Bradyrhizobium sp.]|uniref:TetR-like C-terminal domain-containing protein n=1 Tax=Bradyrhizobium sp. TaxID=376 RepID=UPI00273546A0|nr:TetR-like C-terminal domain-containing protein [Bradyrhizobium sp.]MDP3691518.1 TetR-like C-terminal domain-containing protein [Bradyrhizobium sp.]